MRELTEKQKAWKAHLDAAEAEGQSISAYARANGLSAQTLYAVRCQLRKRSFARVREVRVEPIANLPLQARLPNGVTIALGVDERSMASVLRQLAAL